MNPYLKPSQKNTNPPYDDATVKKFNDASSSALGYLQNRLNDPIYYKRLQNEITQSNKLGNVTYDTKTGALDLLNQRKKGLNEVKFINPNTTDQSEIAIINEIKNKGYLGAFTTGQVGRYEPEYQKEGFMKGALKQDIAGFQKNVIGLNPIMFNQDYEKYLENIIIHEGEHSTQPAYPNYTNPYYNVGMMNVDNGTLPLYRNKSNITPYATNVIKENILSDDDYYSDPMEVVASKRQIEHLFENAPEGTFKKTWKYGDDIQDEHFNYFLDSKNNVQSAILKKALLGDKNLEDLNEEEKQDIKTRFSNIMTKIAYNENNNDNIYTARFGTKVKGKKSNPYIKKYQNGGEGDPEDPIKDILNFGFTLPKNEPMPGLGTQPYQQTPAYAYNWSNPKASTPTAVHLPSGTYNTPQQIEKIKNNKERKESFWNTIGAVDQAIGQYLIQPSFELVNTPFALFAEGVNAIQGKEASLERALPNPTRIAYNTLGEESPIPNQQMLSDFLGVDRDKNPYLALGLDLFTPSPAMITKPIKALTGLDKATKATKGIIQYAPKTNKVNVANAANASDNANTSIYSYSVSDGVYTDLYGNKINPKQVQNFIEEKGLKIIKEGIETPEGRRRLALQLKKEDPKLTTSEIDDLIETRIAETKASVIHNLPRYFQEGIINRPYMNVHEEFDDAFPLYNAFWRGVNPAYPPSSMSSNMSNGVIKLARKKNPFTSKNFEPGTITLGRGYQDDIATLDHEIGHATQKGGQMPIDRELMQLLKPKSIFDKGYEWVINKVIPKTKNDYNYFSKSGGRTWKNEPYAFLREARRQMIEDGILKDTYDKVTPLKLFKHFMGNNASRIIDFTPFWKYSALAKKFNEAPALVPGIIGTGAAGVGINEMMKQTPQNRHGGQNPYITPKYKYGGPVEPVDPEEERRLMQERLMRYIRGNNESNNSILDVRSPNEYGFSLGDRFKIQSGLSLDPMTGMPSGYGKLGINNNGFNLGVEKKKGIGTDASIYNIGYEGPKFNIGASYSKENNIPSISGNIGYNNNGINIGVGGNYSPYNKGISANLGYNNNGINAGLNYDYSGQHSISGNIGYSNDIYNVGLSGNVMPGESNVGINATYNLGVRKPQKREEIAMAYNKPIEINLIKEDDTDTDAEQAVGPPEMNYGGYVNPDDPTLPSAPVNLFSNYDMGYNNPFVDDIDSAMNGMMKARMAIESEIGMNPAAKRMTSLYPKEYIFTGDEMFYDEKVNVPAGSIGTHYTTGDANVMFPIIQENKEGNLFFNRYASPMDKEAMRFETPEEASYFGENYKNIAPMMYNQQEYEKGGNTGHSTVEIERSERVYTPDGKLIMETPADAPTHEEGGVKVTLPGGSLVFPKKYFKALDAASGLPEFKKIAKTMLDNAEKAYLRGEPYSSGGKRNKERTYNA